MSYRQPARTAARGPRRIFLAVGSSVALVLAATTSAATGRPIDSPARAAGTSLSAVSWPARGEAALVLGDGPAAASPHERAVPIASVAKVMTAYLTLKRYPLRGAQDGFTVTITAAQAKAEVRDAALDQSVVAVRSGEHLTERQLLEALLIPSGNNIARVLAARVAGTETRFVAAMNAEARALGMRHTTYTDPSGWDAGTVSTAADQLRIFRHAMRFSAFRQIVSMVNVTLPVAGTLANTNPLIGEGYAGKTGSDSAAGACLAFFTHVTVDGRRMTAVGVVLGQWEDNSTSVSLAAAGDAAQRLVASVTRADGGRGENAGREGSRRRLRLSPAYRKSHTRW